MSAANNSNTNQRCHCRDRGVQIRLLTTAVAPFIAVTRGPHHLCIRKPHHLSSEDHRTAWRTLFARDFLRCRQSTTALNILAMGSLDDLPEFHIDHDIAGYAPMHTHRDFA